MRPRTFFATALAALLVLIAAPIYVSAANTVPAKAKSVLDKGMEAAAIIRLIGRPQEISPIKAEGVSAETWTYRRKVDDLIYQTANTEAYIPAMVGFQSSGLIIGRAIVPDYRLKHAALYQMTALLIVDGKLERGRQWSERTEEFAN